VTLVNALLASGEEEGAEGTKLALLGLFSDPGFGVDGGGHRLVIMPFVSATVEVLLVLAVVAWVWPRLAREPRS
jgi:hypothetical protein